jgi:dienelactone hydrolase
MIPKEAASMRPSSPPSRRQVLRSSGAALFGGLSFPAADLPHVPTVDERIRDLAEAAPLAMEFRGRTADELRTWQAGFAARLRECLGPHRPPVDWKSEVERSVELGDHVREELILTAPGHPPLPVYLLLPRGGSDWPRAGVLALHGHGPYGHDAVAGRGDLPGIGDAIRQSNYDYGRQLARRGYVVAVPCLTPFGRRLGDAAAYGQQDPCAVTFIRMQLLGKLLIAENLRDGLWALELLARQPRVDARRLACVGLSYGGRITMLAAALEPRIRVAVVSGALNMMQERVRARYSCGAQVIPGLLQHGDVAEIGSLIAPRHCLWEVGNRDGLISTEWARTALDRLGRAYRAAGAEGHLQVDRFDGGHRWSGRLAYPLLEDILR